jgi:NAD(P)-dependent dehydrogenase (short-subunit alcohol dehydrogenase family)
MAQTASYELAGQNLLVNAICPGFIEVGHHSVTSI